MANFKNTYSRHLVPDITTFLTWLSGLFFGDVFVYNYKPEYRDRLKRLYSTIEEIADAEDTSFEYVVRDLYGIHLHDY